MSSKLYEPCPTCKGVGTEEDFRECRSCRGRKYVEIGLTNNQLERLLKKADAFDQIGHKIRSIPPSVIKEGREWLAGKANASPWDFVEQAGEAMLAIRDIADTAAGPLPGISIGHILRNQLGPFAATTESILILAERGMIDLSRLPTIRAQLERCHEIVKAMGAQPEQETHP